MRPSAQSVPTSVRLGAGDVSVWREDAERLAAIVRRSRSTNSTEWTGLSDDSAAALAIHDALVVNNPVENARESTDLRPTTKEHHP